MSIEFTISPAQRLVVVTALEPAKLPETLVRCSALAMQSEFVPGFSLLIDARGLRRFAGPNQRKLIAAAVRALHNAAMPRVAIVVSRDRTFGIAKSAADMAHDAALELGVFRSMLAALYWIDFPRAQALQPADIPPAVLADIRGSRFEMAELRRARRAS